MNRGKSPVLTSGQTEEQPSSVGVSYIHVVQGKLCPKLCYINIGETQEGERRASKSVSP